jgi:hypothetical protein
MTGIPDKREEWFGTVRQILGQAKEADDAPMIALLEAVVKLLMGDPVEAIQPELAELEGPHAAAWARIVEGMRGGGD